jgi:hypothetical protein
MAWLKTSKETREVWRMTTVTKPELPQQTMLTRKGTVSTKPPVMHSIQGLAVGDATIAPCLRTTTDRVLGLTDPSIRFGTGSP